MKLGQACFAAFEGELKLEARVTSELCPSLVEKEMRVTPVTGNGSDEFD